MEPARSPQEPPLYVSPKSREEQQLVKELQTITGLEAHVAQRQLRYHEWELQPALAHYLDRGAVSAATSGAHRLLQRLHPNRDARPRVAVRVEALEEAVRAARRGGDGAPVEVMRQRRLQLPLVVAQLSLCDVRFEPRYGLQLFDELLLLARFGAHIEWRLLRRSRRFHR